MTLVQWLLPGHERIADLTVVIVSWNVREQLIANFAALRHSEGAITAELIVVDNASMDGTVERIRETFPDAYVIANTTNAGFSAANMQALLMRRGRHVLLLNPDMRVDAQALQRTVTYLDAHPDVGVLSAKLVQPDGTSIPHLRRFPTLGNQMAILWKIAKLFPRSVKSYLGQDLDFTREQDVDSVRGSYFAIHEKALERCGGLDTRYFLWFEEVDYCRQVHASGMRVRYVPDILAIDLVGTSFAQRSMFWKQQQFTKSMVQYFEKWHPWWQALVLRMSGMMMLPFVWIANKVRHR